MAINQSIVESLLSCSVLFKVEMGMGWSFRDFSIPSPATAIVRRGGSNSKRVKHHARHHDMLSRLRGTCGVLNILLCLARLCTNAPGLPRHPARRKLKKSESCAAVVLSTPYTLLPCRILRACPCPLSFAHQLRFPCLQLPPMSRTLNQEHPSEPPAKWIQEKK